VTKAGGDDDRSQYGISENQANTSHITNHRDKSLVIIAAGGFRQWLELERHDP
jgi:hypothetical protein